MTEEDTVRLIAQSIIVIAGVMLIIGVAAGVVLRAWWDERQRDRLDIESTRRWSRATSILARRLR